MGGIQPGEEDRGDGDHSECNIVVLTLTCTLDALRMAAKSQISR